MRLVFLGTFIKIEEKKDAPHPGMFLRKTYVDIANILNDFNSKLSHEYDISISNEKLLQNALENNLSLIGTFFFHYVHGY